MLLSIYRILINYGERILQESSSSIDRVTEISRLQHGVFRLQNLDSLVKVLI